MVIHDAIESASGDSAGLLSEQTRFLLRELQDLLVADGLVDNDDVVIVAARMGHPEYLAHSAYVCQPGRTFREGLTHMGFYADGEIKTQVPRIRHCRDHVVFSQEEAAALTEGSEGPSTTP